MFGSKSTADGRKASPSALREESESERAFKVLAAHVSPSNMPSFPPQMVVEGLIKQLDTKFQIPKLSARANAAETAEKKSSAEKLAQSTSSSEHSSAKLLVDSITSSKLEQTKIPVLSNISASALTNNPKSSSTDILDAATIQARREITQTKPDILAVTASSLRLMNLGAAMSPASHLMLQPQTLAATTTPPAVSLDSDVPTNLSMSTGDESRDSCKDFTTSASATRPPAVANSQ